jgi:AraC family transcriptional regulator
MEQKWKKILGHMQPLKPGAVDTYVTDVMGVFLPREPIDFSEVDHVHLGYEFVIPFGPGGPYRVESKTVLTEHAKILPFNPEQSHRLVEGTFSHELIALFLDTDFLQGLAGSIYNTKEVLFYNRNFPYDAYLQNLLRIFIEESRQQLVGHDLICQSIATQVGAYILRHVQGNCPSPREGKHYSERKNIASAIDFMHENLSNSFTLDDLARVANLSPYHFLRVFKAEVGKTPFEYLQYLKIEKAKQYLQHRNKSITDVCFESGFTNISHFTRTFSRKVGVTPSAYRKGIL